MLWFSKEPSNQVLLGRLEALENRFSNLRTEFGELADIVYRNLQRLAKLNSNMVKAQETDHEEEASPAQPHVVEAHPGRLLTNNQMKIQQEILRRRAGG